MKRSFSWGWLASAACLCISAPVGAAWQQATSKHFIVYENASPETVKALTDRLERYDSALRSMWRLNDRPETPTSRVTLYMVSGLDDLQKLAGKGGQNVGGFYIPRAGAPVAFMPQRVVEDYGGFQRAVLFHEYAHHIMFTGWGHQVFPGWFIEGFAEFHATVRFQPDGSLLFGAEPRYRQFGVGHDSLMPMDRVLGTFARLKGADEGDAFYARAWLLTDYLILSPNGPKRFAGYMDALNQGESIDKAAAKLGGARQLDGELNAWGKQPTMKTKSVSASQVKVGDIEVRALSAAEAAIIPVRLASTRGVDKQTAPAVAAAARQVAARYPDDASVQTALAEAEYDAENYPASLAAAERAVALAPKSVNALLYRGMAATAQLKKDKAEDPAAWSAARRAFLAANKLDAEDPRPLQLYYESFGDAGKPASANAAAGLLYAQALAPFDMDLRLEAGEVLLGQGKKDEATAMLQPVAFNPHGQARAKLATDTLTTLGTDGPAAALATLRANKGKATADAEKAD